MFGNFSTSDAGHALLVNARWPNELKLAIYSNLLLWASIALAPPAADAAGRERWLLVRAAAETAVCWGWLARGLRGRLPRIDGGALAQTWGASAWLMTGAPASRQTVRACGGGRRGRRAGGNGGHLFYARPLLLLCTCTGRHSVVRK